MHCAPSEKDICALFRALSVESRVRILRLLAGGNLCVGALSRRLGLSAGAVSQHLNVLRKAGLVKAVRCGYFMHYRAAPDAPSRCRVALKMLLPRRGTGKGGSLCAREKRSA